MKHFYFLLCMLAMAASAHSQDYLKLMSYNIRNAKGMDNVRNVQRIANVINNEAPDVVAVQELDSMTTRSNQTYVLPKWLNVHKCMPVIHRLFPFKVESTASAFSPKKSHWTFRLTLCLDEKKNACSW